MHNLFTLCLSHKIQKAYYPDVKYKSSFFFFCKAGRFWVGTKGRETGAGILPPEQGSLVSMHDAECLLVKTELKLVNFSLELNC